MHLCMSSFFVGSLWFMSGILFGLLQNGNAFPSSTLNNNQGCKQSRVSFRHSSLVDVLSLRLQCRLVSRIILKVFDFVEDTTRMTETVTWEVNDVCCWVRSATYDSDEERLPRGILLFERLRINDVKDKVWKKSSTLSWCSVVFFELQIREETCKRTGDEESLFEGEILFLP